MLSTSLFVSECLTLPQKNFDQKILLKRHIPTFYAKHVPLRNDYHCNFEQSFVLIRQEINGLDILRSLWGKINCSFIK